MIMDSGCSRQSSRWDNNKMPSSTSKPPKVVKEADLLDKEGGQQLSSQSPTHFIGEAVTFLAKTSKEMAEESTEMKKPQCSKRKHDDEEESEVKTVAKIGFKACTFCNISWSKDNIKHFDTLQRCDGCCFDPETGKFTAPKGGRYHVHFSCDNELCQVELYQNQDDEPWKGNPPITYKKVTVGTHVMNLKANDCLYLKGNYPSEDADGGTASVGFAVSYLG